jgi:hypothetical protein
MLEVDELDLTASVGKVLNRWPAAGLAVGVVRDGALAWFHGHGVSPRLATGYAPRSGGLKAVADREIAVAGAGSVYSTVNDMARYVSALLDGGANQHGSVLKPASLATMFEPHYQPDPRIPGMGLGFFRGEVGGHRTVGHDGIWKGFLSDLVLAPDEGIGVLALANTGGFDVRGAPVPVANALLRRLLDLPDDAVRTDVPQHPWLWRDLCGWYSLGPGVLTDSLSRVMLGAGVEVVVRHGQLTIRGQIPLPAVRKGLRLHPEGDNPDVFRIDLSGFGLGTSRVVFSRAPDGEVTGLYLGLVPMSFQKRPDIRNPRPWVNAAIVAGATTIAVRRHATRHQHRTAEEVRRVHSDRS